MGWEHTQGEMIRLKQLNAEGLAQQAHLSPTLAVRTPYRITGTSNMGGPKQTSHAFSTTTV